MTEKAGKGGVTADRVNPEALFREFEDGVLSDCGFGHREHVMLAWCHIRHYSLLTALARFTNGIQLLTRRVGAPEKYHATITSAYMLIVSERMGEPSEDWLAFAARNPALFQWPSPVLMSYYQADTLASARARETFVLPDRVAP